MLWWVHQTRGSSKLGSETVCLLPCLSVYCCFFHRVNLCEPVTAFSLVADQECQYCSRKLLLFFDCPYSTARLGQRQPISSCFRHPSNSLSPGASGPSFSFVDTPPLGAMSAYRTRCLHSPTARLTCLSLLSVFS